MPVGRFYRRPYVVEAWKITADELPDIARWCHGRVKGLSITFSRIRDKSKVLLEQDRRAYAVLGQVLMKTSKGFVVMDNTDFDAKYAPMKEEKPKDEGTISALG